MFVKNVEYELYWILENVVTSDTKDQPYLVMPTEPCSCQYLHKFAEILEIYKTMINDHFYIVGIVRKYWQNLYQDLCRNCYVLYANK